MDSRTVAHSIIAHTGLLNIGQQWPNYCMRIGHDITICRAGLWIAQREDDDLFVLMDPGRFSNAFYCPLYTHGLF